MKQQEAKQEKATKGSDATKEKHQSSLRQKEVEVARGSSRQ